MKNMIQILIAGGGLAGLTAAIHLAKNGFQVVVIDKDSYPRHKVCGEYISNEVIPYLKWLGVDPAELNPTKISKINFSTSSGQTVDGILPLGGFGVSRYTFDYYLYQKAIQLGCNFIENTITDISFTEDNFTITLSDHSKLSASVVLGAFGKRSNIDLKLKRPFISKKSPWLAVKGHFLGDFPEEVVGLHNFEGGYCGVSKVEDSKINICYLADFETFKKYKNIEDYEKNVLCKNPILQSVFDNVVPIFEKPMTISQISFDQKNCVEDHILLIGDTAGLIHPLCGNGMAMAIHSAKVAAELVSRYFNDPQFSRLSLENLYEMQWKQNFKYRLQTGRMLSKLLQNKKLSEVMMKVVAIFPSILPTIIKKTHGKLIPLPQ